MTLALAVNHAVLVKHHPGSRHPHVQPVRAAQEQHLTRPLSLVGNKSVNPRQHGSHGLNGKHRNQERSTEGYNHGAEP